MPMLHFLVAVCRSGRMEEEELGGWFNEQSISWKESIKSHENTKKRRERKKIGNHEVWSQNSI